jgi:CRP-like cAMP-binding protein
MPLDWFSERPSEGLAVLIASKQYNQAIDVLRTRLQQKRPDTKTRLRLADLLMQAGRGPEAVPLLLGLSDDFASEGAMAKAIAALKRVEKLKPNLPEVAQRLDRLARQRALALTPGPGPGAEAVSSPPPAAISTVVAVPSEPSPAVSIPAAADVSRITPAPEAAALAPAPATPAPVTATPSVVSSTPAPAVAVPAPAEPASESVVLRFRGLLGRLLGGRGEARARPVAELTQPPVPAQPAEVAVVSEPVPEPGLASGAALVAEAQPASEARVTDAPVPSSEADARTGQESVASEVAPESRSEVGPPDGAAATAHDVFVTLGPEDTHPPMDLIGVEIQHELPPEVELAPEVQPVAVAADEAVVVTGVAAIDDAPDRAASTLAPAPTSVAIDVTSAAVEQVSPDEPATDPVASEPAPVDAQNPEPAPVVRSLLSESALAEAPLDEDAFREKLLSVVEEVLETPPPAADSGAAKPAIAFDTARLQSNPLLVELDEPELRQLLGDLKLRIHEPGDIVLTEGEPGETLFLLASGQMKVFVRNPKSRNVELHEFTAGDFFGEVALLSGRPRTATVVAATTCELLELDRPTLERLSRTHPGIVDMLEAYYLVRTQSASAVTLRGAVANDADMQRRATDVLRAHFGETRWDARMRLKLADVLLKSGKEQEALPILVGLADELARRGHTEKAVAILKRIERIEGRHTEEISLAPLRRKNAPATPEPAEPVALPAAEAPDNEDGFQGWLLELVRETVERGLPQRGPARTPGLLMSPLFEGFADDELLALVRGLRLVDHAPGDIVVSEGEPGDSVFVLTGGAVKVFVQDPRGHNVLVGGLREGEFFGEISLLSGRARSATITATTACELLELDKTTLERLCSEHPRVRAVLEEVYIERASHPLAAMVRSAASAVDDAGSS